MSNLSDVNGTATEEAYYRPKRPNLPEQVQGRSGHLGASGAAVDSKKSRRTLTNLSNTLITVAVGVHERLTVLEGLITDLEQGVIPTETRKNPTDPTPSAPLDMMDVSIEMQANASERLERLIVRLREFIG